MKFITTTSAAALIAATSMANAGGMAEPIMTMEPAMVMDESASSSSNFIIPLILVALIFAASSSSGGDIGELVSDARAKTDIVPVGVAADGLNVYQYSYIGSSAVFEGVMAQEVLMHTPQAVVTYPNGMMAVNYDMLGMTLKVVD